MIRRDFIKNAGVVSTAIGLVGQAAIVGLLKPQDITFPSSFSDMERSHILELYNKVKPHMNDRILSRSAIAMLQPKTLVERNEQSNGDYETIYMNKMNNKVSLLRKEGKNFIKFL